MKFVRVPWIRCRADEVDAVPTEMEWRGRIFQLLAYSEKEARDWWRSISDREREEALDLPPQRRKARDCSEETGGAFAVARPQSGL